MALKDSVVENSVVENSLISELHKNKKGHYVYKYVYNGKIIYIGINNTNFIDRLNQHGRSGDNIRKEAWDKLTASDIYYIKLLNQTMTDVVESELIRRYLPKYNVAKKNSDWSGLPFVEPEWIKFDKTILKKQTKKVNNKKIEKPFDFYETNKDALNLLVYIFEQLENRNFYLCQTHKNDYSYPKYARDFIHLYIDLPDWCNDDIGYIRYEDKNSFGTHSILSTIVKYKNGNRELLINIDDPLIFDAYDWINAFKESINNNFPEIFNLLNTMQEFKNNWEKFIDGCNDLYIEAPPDPGLSIKIEHDSLSRRNNNYFWKWYIGCKLAYSNGSYMQFYKNGKWSKPIAYFNIATYNGLYRDSRNGIDNKNYFLEEYIDYYLSHWIEQDNVVLIAGSGLVECGDYIGHFDTKIDDADYNIEMGMSLIKENNIKIGEGTDRR